jgi:hypothetical protein
MWKDKLEVTPLRGVEMVAECVAAVAIVFIILLTIGSLAYAQHAAKTGTGIVCDTPEQVARYIKSKEGDGTLAAINAENKNASAIIGVAFFTGEKSETITNGQGSWQITKILIVGVAAQDGIHPVDPVVQWSAFYIEERGASLPFILATWKPEYAQNAPEVNHWYKNQEMTDDTWRRLGSPSWHSCCEKGDVFKTQIRVGKGTQGDDEWWYLKDGIWKQVPADTIHWAQHAPSGLPTLFIYSNTGQELCFYPPEEGI